MTLGTPFDLFFLNVLTGRKNSSHFGPPLPPPPPPPSTSAQVSLALQRACIEKTLELILSEFK